MSRLSNKSLTVAKGTRAVRDQDAAGRGSDGCGLSNLSLPVLANTFTISPYANVIHFTGRIMRTWFWAPVVSAVLLGGCASKSDDVGSIYVSPLSYQSLNCQQIGQEAERVSRRAAEVAGVQDSNATNDAVLTGVGSSCSGRASFFSRAMGRRQRSSAG